MKKTGWIFGIAGLIFAIAVSVVVIDLVAYPLKYKTEIKNSAADAGIEPALIAAVIRAESKFRPDAVSGAGAVGLMQLMPETAMDTAKEIGLSDYDLTAPADNIRLGARYLAKLSARYAGRTDLVAAAYNAGPGRVDAWLADPELSQEGELVTIPFRETRDYVARVKSGIRRYAKKF